MYTLNHKYFLQFMLKNSYISINKALEFCDKHPIDKVSNLTTLKQFITEINFNIKKQYLKLVILKCEVTSNDFLVLVNSANDDITKLQSVYNVSELDYFQHLLHELVVVSENHRLKKMNCFNMTTVKGLSKDNIEKLLTKLMDNGYLVEKDSYVYLGARCIVEFAPHFNENCRDYYSDCFLCSEMVFVGGICASCDKLMHKNCLDKYLAKKRACPSCKVDWVELDYANTQASNDSSLMED
ncbi:hypothetical protein FQR65_LT03562 [Abscondita terminalis]|nr:hypothetical protein FQR65_LT03562 [Abscondita terminalis]